MCHCFIKEFVTELYDLCFFAQYGRCVGRLWSKS